MIVQNKAELLQMVGSLRGANFLAFDIESTGFDPYTEQLVMLQFWDGEGPVYIVDARIACSSSRKAKFLGEILKTVFDEAGCITGHNLKFDLAWVQHHLGIELSKLNIWDTMIAEQYIKGLGLSDAMKQGISFSLKDTAKRYDAGEMSKEERNWFIHLNSRGDEWGLPFPPEQIEYAERDVRVLKPIYEAQRRTIEARGMLPAMQDEMGALIALVQCELNGINLNVSEWRAFIKEKEAEAEEYYTQVFEVFAPAIQAARLKKFDEEMEVYRAWEQEREGELSCLRGRWSSRAGDFPYDSWGKFKADRMKAWRAENPNPGKPKLSTDPPNLGSPTQLLDALHARGIEVQSAGVEVLEPLKDQYPEIALLLQWRKSIKFSQSFGESLLEKINPVTGRLHPTFHQIGASSGRMSCTNPNFQQIPSKGDGAKIRACVVAPQGSKLIVADYSAQELRILSDLSGDARMLDFFEREVDLHEATARVMFSISEDQPVPKELRTYSKTINYGIAYGMSAFSLAMRLKVDPDRGEELMDAWFKTYPSIKGWLAERAKYTKHHRTSPTATGWVRRFAYHTPEPTKPGRGESSAAWGKYHEAVREYKQAMGRLARQGMNTPIQGAAAGITKKALALLVRGCYNGTEIRSSGQGTPNKIQFKILAVVHDEIVLEAREENAEAAAEYLADCMDQACKAVLKRVHVPRTAVKISDHWEHD